MECRVVQWPRRSQIDPTIRKRPNRPAHPKFVQQKQTKPRSPPFSHATKDSRSRVRTPELAIQRVNKAPGATFANPGSEHPQSVFPLPAHGGEANSPAKANDKPSKPSGRKVPLSYPLRARHVR